MRGHGGVSEELRKQIDARAQRVSGTTAHDLDRVRRAFNWIEKNGVCPLFTWNVGQC